MRTLFIAGNWKMNPPPDGAFDLDAPYQPHDKVDVAIFPTFLDLGASIEAGVPTGGQFGHPDPHGAHTGDVSMEMLKAIGCTYVLCGHSDRRAKHGESNETVGLQAVAALDSGLMPICCFGETWEEREAGNAQTVVRAQLEALPLDREILLAYEPVWAISQGDPNKPSATPEDAQEMHAFIRSLLPNGDTTRILYGGSMKPENAEELLDQPDIDGGLVGGASLKPDAFGAIVTIAAVLTE